MKKNIKIDRKLTILRPIKVTLPIAAQKFTLESDHFSRISGCIKLEVDISMRNIFCLNKNGLRGRIIWQGPRKVSEISYKNSQGMNKIQKFLCEVDGHDKSEFLFK